VLSEFRGRLLAHGAERRLFDRLVEQFRERGWIKTRGKQRTDSTHVLAAIRTLRRLECVGETMRHARERSGRSCSYLALGAHGPRVGRPV
jgi:transposase